MFRKKRCPRYERNYKIRNFFLKTWSQAEVFDIFAPIGVCKINQTFFQVSFLVSKLNFLDGLQESIIFD